MIWSQEIVKGKLTGIGDGTWSNDTFKASFIEIGGRSIPDVSMASCLIGRMGVGKEMDLLICSSHIYGVRLNGQTFREGAMRQLGWALLVAATLCWIFLPLAAAALIFVRRAYAIYSF